MNKMLDAIEKLFNEDPELVDKIIKEVDEMDLQGPTVEEYLARQTTTPDQYWYWCFFYYKIFFRYSPVKECLLLATSSGVPLAIILPPCTPPCGPKSMR